MTRRTLIIATGASLLCSGPLFGAQSVPSEPTCSTCQIHLEQIVVLRSSDADEAGIYAPPASVDRDQLGRYWVTFSVPEQLPVIFSRTGEPLRAVGRLGDGPGEFRQPISVSFESDKVYIFDSMLARLTVVDLELNLLETVPIPGRQLRSAVAVGEGRFVVNMILQSEESFGYALHLIDDSGAVLSSFEPYDPTLQDPTAHLRHIAVDGEELWVAPYFGRMELSRFSIDGTLSTRWQWPSTPADKLPRTYGDPSESQPPTRQTTGIMLADGLVYIVSRVPGQGWRGALRRVSDPLHKDVYVPSDMQSLFDGTVEAFDPATGRLVASKQSQAVPADIPGSGAMAAQLSADEMGWLSLSVLSPAPLSE